MPYGGMCDTPKALPSNSLTTPKYTMPAITLRALCQTSTPNPQTPPQHTLMHALCSHKASPSFKHNISSTPPPPPYTHRRPACVVPVLRWVAD